MAIAKQGSYVKAPVKGNDVGGKSGGGVVKGGGTFAGKTPSPKPGNPVKIKTSR